MLFVENRLEMLKVWSTNGENTDSKKRNVKLVKKGEKKNFYRSRFSFSEIQNG